MKKRIAVSSLFVTAALALSTGAVLSSNSTKEYPDTDPVPSKEP